MRRLLYVPRRWPPGTIQVIIRESLNRKPLLTFIVVSSAQQCYSNTISTFDCTYFVKNNLHGTINGSASCPFSEEICRSNSSNIILDTGYIDSIEDLGMNSPQDESIKFRTVLQCAPLETHGYTSNKSTPTDNFTQYYYGSFLYGLNTQDATFTVESLDSQYLRQADNPQSGGRNMILR